MYCFYTTFVFFLIIGAYLFKLYFVKLHVKYVRFMVIHIVKLNHFNYYFTECNQYYRKPISIKLNVRQQYCNSN